MQHIHVCLVSDQTIPNILAIEEFKPDEVLMISTEKMEIKGKSGHILECLAGRGLDYRKRHSLIVVKEDSLLDCNQKLESWVEGREDSEFVVNLTGGTKIMSIAAYEFFKDCGSPMIYIPIPRNEYITLFSKGPSPKPVALSQRLLVLDYLRAYGLTIINGRHLEGMAGDAEARRELAHWMVVHYEEIKNLLVWLGGALRSHRDDRQFVLEGSFKGATTEERELMTRMGLSMNGSDLKKKMPKSEIQFLTGGWLEEYCYNEVNVFRDHGVDDVVVGIEIKNTKGPHNEFDVMFTKDNALYTVECKSLDQQDDKKTEALYKVGALQKNFGLRVRSFFVSTASNILGKNGALKPSIAARADHLNTIVVAPNEVACFRQVLSNELKLNG